MNDEDVKKMARELCATYLRYEHHKGRWVKVAEAAIKSALTARESAEPVGWVRSKFGDPEAFGEREIEANDKVSQSLPYNTPLFTYPPDQSARIAELEEALRWYQEQAEAVSRHSIVIDANALGAIITSLGLDAGKRAKDVLTGRGKT